MNDRLKIIFAGSGEFGLPALRALLESGHELVQVFSQPDRPAGRGRTLTPTPIAAYAIEHSLPVIRTANINVECLPPADLMVVIAFGQKISPRVVDHPRLGSVNLHASILPKYRGAAPINWAIVRGETVSGNSIIRLAEKMDAGAVLAQSRMEIGELETAGELHDRLADDGAPLVIRVVEELANGRATETPQDDSRATLAPKLSRSDAALDFARSARELSAQVRGFYPWPGCAVDVMDSSDARAGTVTLVRARAIESRSGSVGEANDAGVFAGDGSLLEIVEVKPEGGKPMPLSAYRNGHPWTGCRLIAKQSQR